jgi:hypothetical protein
MSIQWCKRARDAPRVCGLVPEHRFIAKYRLMFQRGATCASALPGVIRANAGTPCRQNIPHKTLDVNRASVVSTADSARETSSQTF